METDEKLQELSKLFPTQAKLQLQSICNLKCAHSGGEA